MNSSRSSSRLAALQKRAACNRSAARLAVLQKSAGPVSDFQRGADTVGGAYGYYRALDPANVAAAGGVLGGGKLLFDAATGANTESGTGRVAKGILGTGLMGAGIYAGMNDNARNAIRQAVFELIGKAGRAVESRLGKTAADDSSTTNAISEVAGHLTAPTILGILGGLAAKHPAGFIAGQAVGHTGSAIGGLAALLKSRRSAGAQRDYDSESHILRNLLVPGQGSYNMWKRVGRIVGSSNK